MNMRGQKYDSEPQLWTVGFYTPNGEGGGCRKWDIKYTRISLELP